MPARGARARRHGLCGEPAHAGLRRARRGGPHSYFRPRVAKGGVDSLLAARPGHQPGYRVALSGSELRREGDAREGRGRGGTDYAGDPHTPDCDARDAGEGHACYSFFFREPILYCTYTPQVHMHMHMHMCMCTVTGYTYSLQHALYQYITSSSRGCGMQGNRIPERVEVVKCANSQERRGLSTLVGFSNLITGF